MIRIKKSAMILIPVLALSAYGAFTLPERRKTQEAAEAATAPEAPREVSCIGRIVPGERVIRVTAQLQSVVKELRVKRKDRVKKGDILATLLEYDANLKSLRQAEAQAAVAESQLARVKAGEKEGIIAAQRSVVARSEAELRTARVNYDRYKALSDKDVVSRARYDDSELALERASRSLEEAREVLAGLKEIRPVDVTLREKELAAARAAVDLAAARLELCLVRAPIDGQVLEISAYPGESIGREGILSLADTASIMVDAEVYVTDIRNVRLGAGAVVRGDGVDGEVAGTVAEILGSVMDNALFDPNPLAYSDKRVIRVRIRMDESGKLAHLINSQVFVRISP